jgi:hypothetical protein
VVTAGVREIQHKPVTDKNVVHSCIAQLVVRYCFSVVCVLYWPQHTEWCTCCCCCLSKKDYKLPAAAANTERRSQ